MSVVESIIALLILKIIPGKEKTPNTGKQIRPANGRFLLSPYAIYANCDFTLIDPVVCCLVNPRPTHSGRRKNF